MVDYYNDVKEEIRFITTISIFLVTVINLFFRMYGIEGVDKLTFNFSGLILLYLVSYFLLHWNKKGILHSTGFLRGIKALILLNIASFGLWLALFLNLDNMDKWALVIPVLSLLGSVLSKFFTYLAFIILPVLMVLVLAFYPLFIRDWYTHQK